MVKFISTANDGSKTDKGFKMTFTGNEQLFFFTFNPRMTKEDKEKQNYTL